MFEWDTKGMFLIYVAILVFAILGLTESVKSVYVGNFTSTGKNFIVFGQQLIYAILLIPEFIWDFFSRFILDIPFATGIYATIYNIMIDYVFPLQKLLLRVMYAYFLIAFVMMLFSGEFYYYFKENIDKIIPIPLMAILTFAVSIVVLWSIKIITDSDILGLN